MSPLWYYSYEVDFYDEDENKITRGIVAGTSFKEVVERLVDFYGDDYINSIKTEIVDESEGVYEINTIIKDKLKLN